MMRVSATLFCFTAFLTLLIHGGGTHADVITTGDVDPPGRSPRPNPWVVGGILYVGNSGTGTLAVEAGGVVSNNYGVIADNVGSMGEVTVAGSVQSDLKNIDPDEVII